MSLETDTWRLWHRSHTHGKINWGRGGRGEFEWGRRGEGGALVVTRFTLHQSQLVLFLLTVLIGCVADVFGVSSARTWLNLRVSCWLELFGSLRGKKGNQGVWANNLFLHLAIKAVKVYYKALCWCVTERFASFICVCVCVVIQSTVSVVQLSCSPPSPFVLFKPWRCFIGRSVVMLRDFSDVLCW